MAFFDTSTNPFEGMNIFGARQPEYLGGLLTQDQQEKLKNQSLLSGTLSALATYAATPKNQGIGIPAIIGKAYLGGMQGAQNPYTQATENELTKLKIAKEQRDALLDVQKAIPTDVREYEFAKSQGFKGTFQDWASFMANARTPKTTINMPNPNKAILDVDKDTLTGLVASTNSARSIANQTRTINSLIGDQQGSGAIKLTSDLQNFLGINTPTANVNQAVQAIATKAATEIRTPGSGSTSDLEFGAYRSAFPSLATSKAGREIMVKIAEANAARNAKLSDWTRKNIQQGTFSYEGLAAYDNSLGQAVGNDIKKRVEELTATKPSGEVTLSPAGQKAYDFYINQNRKPF